MYPMLVSELEGKKRSLPSISGKTKRRCLIATLAFLLLSGCASIRGEATARCFGRCGGRVFNGRVVRFVNRARPVRRVLGIGRYRGQAYYSQYYPQSQNQWGGTVTRTQPRVICNDGSCRVVR
jgi:hypothetical protein